ncbi:MAG: endonuclease/exonuclease/phosphatase family protein [Propionicimonas sp.]|nr:endonuclease/exonuclease/phosphatase family protein [Propionicimonas sp.]
MRARRAVRGLGTILAVALVTGCGPVVPADPWPTPDPTATQESPATTPPSSASPSTTQASAAPLALTVMTYNTLTGRNDCAGCRALRAAGRGDELALARRMPAAAAKIALAAPDIIGFQENEGPDRLPQQHLAGLLGDYAWAEPGSPVPIAVRADSFRVVESGVTDLESGPRACRSGDRTDGRQVTWALVEEIATGRRLWVFNTHLHPFDTARCAAMRAENVDRLLAVVAERNPDGELPHLVIGDFNAFGDERRSGFRHHLDAMAAAGMVDSHEIAAEDTSDVPGAASAGWMTATVGGRSRVGVVRRGGRYLDYIWVPEGSTVGTWQVLSGPGVGYRRIGGEKVPYWTGVMASDHSPVVAAVVLGASGG